MKKKVNPTIKEYKMPELYLEDLFTLESILKETKSEVQIETGEYHYESVGEIPEDGARIHQIDFKISEPYISLELHKFEARLYASSDSTETLGIISKIDKLLLPLEQKTYWYLEKVVPLFGGFLLGHSISRFISSYRELSILDKVFWVTISVSATLLVFSLIYKSQKQYSTIYLVFRKKRNNFFQRNKDQLVLIVITALITYFCTKYL